MLTFGLSKIHKMKLNDLFTKKEPRMYVKVVQFTSTSKIQKEMLGAYLQTVWFPELIKLGALSCRYVSLDDTKSMIINMFPDEAIGESVQVGREEQRKELREQHKYTVFKGYSEFYLEK